MAVQVEEASFSPVSREPWGDGEMRARVRVGEQELSSRWHVAANDELSDLLHALAVTVEEVSFVTADGDAEIRAQLRLGDQRYVTRFPLQGGTELRDDVDRLLHLVAARFVRGLQPALGGDEERPHP